VRRLVKAVPWLATVGLLAGALGALEHTRAPVDILLPGHLAHHLNDVGALEVYGRPEASTRQLVPTRIDGALDPGGADPAAVGPPGPSGLAEDAEDDDRRAPSPARVSAWVDVVTAVFGRADWIFAKIHTQGIQARSRAAGDAADRMLSYLESAHAQGLHRSHFITVGEFSDVARAGPGSPMAPPRHRGIEIEPPGELGAASMES
jgi:hypothetical protein